MLIGKLFMTGGMQTITKFSKLEQMVINEDVDKKEKKTGAKYSFDSGLLLQKMITYVFVLRNRVTETLGDASQVIRPIAAQIRPRTIELSSRLTTAHQRSAHHTSAGTDTGSDLQRLITLLTDPELRDDRQVNEVNATNAPKLISAVAITRSK